jgi:predicted NUDIX family NTP pyrophosphohydrolase
MYEVYDNISEVFEAKGLDVADQRKASSIYFSYLSKSKQQDDVFERLAVCFLETTAEKDVYDLVSETFQVEMPANSRGKMDRFYGITPIRVTKETTGEGEASSPEPSS